MYKPHVAYIQFMFVGLVVLKYHISSTSEPSTYRFAYSVSDSEPPHLQTVWHISTDIL